MDKQKYVKWYKTAKEVINDETLIPTRSDGKILDCVSEEDWLMFLPENITRERAKSLPEPNVYFFIRDRSNVIGLTFNNVKAVDKIKNILSSYSINLKEAVVSKLLRLDNNWKTVLNRKIKEKHNNRPPRYIPELTIESNTIDDKRITEFFELSNRIRKEGREKAKEMRAKLNIYYNEVPSINLMRISINLTEEDYKKRIKEVFDVLRLCSDVKSDSEIRRIRREENKPINIKKCPNCLDIYKYSNRTICRKIACSGTYLERTKIPKNEYEKLLKENMVNT